VLAGCRRIASAPRLAVHDTGVVVADQRIIFDEFGQLGNVQRDRSQGIGLALSIVQRLARLQGFALHLQSVPGRGTALASDLRGRRVLVVDDERLIQDALSKMPATGHRIVILALSAPGAPGKLSDGARPPGLLLCDCRLRNGRDGLQPIRARREAFNRDVRTVMATGDTADDKLREHEASSLQALYKPVDADTLRRATGLVLPATA
jgi:CheY-like chemotaxis protein